MLRSLLVALVIVTLTGCGFHLRGAQPLPEAMARTQVVAPGGSALRYELEAQLRGAGGEVVDAAGGESAVLTLHGEKMRSRILSLDTLGRAREYALTLSVAYSLIAADGTVLVPTQNALVERDWRVDPDSVLAQAGEREVIEREMRQAAAQQILRRLRATAGAVTPAQPESGNGQ